MTTEEATRPEGAAAAMGDGWDVIPADVFSEILLRVPPCPRRRLRLVCRHWRSVIDERTPETRSRAKVLAFFGERRGGSRAVIFDDVPPGGGKKKSSRCGGGGRELDLQGSGADAAGVRMIGTCNGLICVLRESGNVAVLNAAVRQMADALSLPTSTWTCLDASTYTFGYHATTGQYKVVHVPCDEQSAELAAVYVLTLEVGGGGGGGLSSLWREVAAPAGSGWLLRFGLVTIGGVAYWVTKDTARIMAFDLGDETFTPLELEWPPMLVLLWMEEVNTCHLTEVRGRLGLVVRRLHHEPKRPKTTEVWVLEGEREEEKAWVKSFTVLAQGGETAGDGAATRRSRQARPDHQPAAAGRSPVADPERAPAARGEEAAVQRGAGRRYERGDEAVRV
ncbi:unnamed protein product [Urochloa humidicola]